MSRGVRHVPLIFFFNPLLFPLLGINYLLTALLQFVTLLIGNNYNDYLRTTYEAMTDQKISINDLPDLLTVREVAEVLRVSPLTIKRWGKRGKLPAIRINSRGDRRYKKEAVLWLLGIQEKSGTV